MHHKFMALAAKEAYKGMKKNEGGPFGAVVVRKGNIISQTHNMVIKTLDPSAHAEIVAIRLAAKKIGRFHLPDCELYTTCEPCPMCLGAIHWAKISRVYYGCDRKDAEAAGFDDNFIHKVMAEEFKKTSNFVQVEKKICSKLFDMWAQKEDKIFY